MAARMPNEEGRTRRRPRDRRQPRPGPRHRRSALARDGLSVAIHYATQPRPRPRRRRRRAAGWPRAPGQRFVLVGRRRVPAPPTARPSWHDDPAGAGPARRPGEQRGHGAAGPRRHRWTPARRASTSSMAVNLKGPYFLAQAAARHWLAASGREPAAGRLQARVRLLHLRLHGLREPRRVLRLQGRAGHGRQALGGAPGREGVQVFEVRPGIMATDMTAGVKEKYDQLIAEGLVPAGALGNRRRRRARGGRAHPRPASPSPPATSSTSTAACTCRGSRAVIRIDPSA